MFAPTGTSFASILAPTIADDDRPTSAEEHGDMEAELTHHKPTLRLEEAAHAVTPAPATTIAPVEDMSHESEPDADTGADAQMPEAARPPPPVALLPPRPPQASTSKPARRAFCAPRASGAGSWATAISHQAASQQLSAGPRLATPKLSAPKRSTPGTAGPSDDKDEDDDKDDDNDDEDIDARPVSKALCVPSGLGGGRRYQAPFAAGSASAAKHGSVAGARVAGDGMRAASKKQQERFNPDAEGAIVLQRADSEASERAVIIEPLIGIKLRPHQVEVRAMPSHMRSPPLCSTFVILVGAHVGLASSSQGVQFIFDALLGKNDPRCRGCILADDMGLGKTMQTIASAYGFTWQPHARPSACTLRSHCACAAVRV